MYTNFKKDLISLTTIIIMILIILLINVHIYNNTSIVYGLSESIIEFNADAKTFNSVSEVMSKSITDASEIIKAESHEEEVEEILEVQTTRSIAYNEINVYTDLSLMNTVTAEQMNTIIEYWNSATGGNSPFVGHGQTFIDASISSGLDPVYLLAHAGLESAWGKSNIAVNKNNYFGIGAYDSSPYISAYSMGDSVSQGIMAGAIWISENYYNIGQTNLYNMRYNNGIHEYCTSTTWMYEIAEIMQTSYSIIQL